MVVICFIFRFSFPSAHASFSGYSMVFLAVSIQFLIILPKASSSSYKEKLNHLVLASFKAFEDKSSKFLIYFDKKVNLSQVFPS